MFYMSRVSEKDKLVGAKVREERKKLGIKQKWLAKQLGISPQQFFKYEIGKDRISAATIKDIAAALRCDLNLLLDIKTEE